MNTREAEHRVCMEADNTTRSKRYEPKYTENLESMNNITIAFVEELNQQL